MEKVMQGQGDEIIQAWFEAVMKRFQPHQTAPRDKTLAAGPVSDAVHRELTHRYEWFLQSLFQRQPTQNLNRDPIPNGAGPSYQLAKHFALAGIQAETASTYPWELKAIIKRHLFAELSEQEFDTLTKNFDPLIEKMTGLARQQYDEAIELIATLKNRERQNGALANLPAGSTCPSAVQPGSNHAPRIQPMQYIKEAIAHSQ